MVNLLLLLVEVMMLLVVIEKLLLKLRISRTLEGVGLDTEVSDS